MIHYVPTICETKRRVDKVFGLSDEGTGERNQRRGFANTKDNTADNRAHECIAQESTEWPSVRDSSARSKEQSSTDSTSKGNHTKVSLLNATNKILLRS